MRVQNHVVAKVTVITRVVPVKGKGRSILLTVSNQPKAIVVLNDKLRKKTMLSLPEVALLIVWQGRGDLSIM